MNTKKNKKVAAVAAKSEIINAANAVEDTVRPLTRIERWIEAMPEAINRICTCQAMQDGKLLPIPTLEKIDGRKIETIVLANLRNRFINDASGNYSYTYDEDNGGSYGLRRRVMNDVQFTILHLVDFGDYVPQESAEQFYKEFYRQGDAYASDVARRAILAAIVKK